jgi:hypothetical protein
MTKPVSLAVLREAARLSEAHGVTIRVEGDIAIVTPKGANDADEFDLVRMKRK